MSKITNITVATSLDAVAKNAIIAVMSPFGSLMATEGDGVTLAERLLSYLKQREHNAQVGHVADILRSLWSAETNDYAELTVVGPWGLRLTTPTSKTVIKVDRYATGDTKVSIGFGLKGSDCRAREILEVLLTQAIPFTATAGDNQLTYRQCVTFVLNDWTARLQDMDEGGNESYPQRDHVASQIETFSHMLPR